MKNNKKQDDITVNVITPPNDVKITSKKPTGNAQDDPSCVYAHMRHAAGSIIKNEDGSQMVCTKDSTWQNS